MWNRGTLGSFSESHCAKTTRTDRRNFIPQIGQLPFASPFSGRLPQSDRSDAKKATGMKATDAACAANTAVKISLAEKAMKRKTLTIPAKP